jgi:hypothetical protein
MRRIAVIPGLCALLLLLPSTAGANPIIINQFGTVSITDAGILSAGSQLINFFGVRAAPEHSLGSVGFSTGPLMTGSLFSGGTFSSTGSTFDVVGVGAWAKEFTGCSKCSNPIPLFSASFVGPIDWTLVSHTGKYEYVFSLSGAVRGELWNGRLTSGFTAQTIYADQNQWVHDHRGDIHNGRTNFRVSPEPGTLGLFFAGLVVLATAMRRKLIAS